MLDLSMIEKFIECPNPFRVNKIYSRSSQPTLKAWECSEESIRTKEWLQQQIQNTARVNRTNIVYYEIRTIKFKVQIKITTCRIIDHQQAQASPPIPLSSHHPLPTAKTINQMHHRVLLKVNKVRYNSK